MKLLPLLILIILGLGAYWFFKTDTKDNAARKEAVAIKATIEKLRCEQRLKGDKSLVVVAYHGKSYSLFVEENICYSYQLNQEITAYYSKTYDRLFLKL